MRKGWNPWEEVEKTSKEIEKPGGGGLPGVGQLKKLSAWCRVEVLFLHCRSLPSPSPRMLTLLPGRLLWHGESLPCVGASSGASPGWSLCSQPSSGSSLACLEPPQDLADGSRILISGMSCCSFGLELVEASPGPVTAPAVSLPALGHLGV